MEGERAPEDRCRQNKHDLLKGIVHPKVKILSSFTHPHVVPNLYEYLCSAEYKGGYSEESGEKMMTEFLFLGELSL